MVTDGIGIGKLLGPLGAEVMEVLWATRTTAGRGYAYRAAVRDAAELAVRDVVRDHGDAAIAYFVNQADADPALRERLRRLMGGGGT